MPTETYEELYQKSTGTGQQILDRMLVFSWTMQPELDLYKGWKLPLLLQARRANKVDVALRFNCMINVIALR